jgi:hypothetical protein
MMQFCLTSITSSFLDPNTSLSTLFSDTLGHLLPFVWETKFHIHTVQLKL